MIIIIILIISKHDFSEDSRKILSAVKLMKMNNISNNDYDNNTIDNNSIL